MVNVLLSRSSALNYLFVKNVLDEILKPNMKVVVIAFSFFGNLTKEEYNQTYSDNSEYVVKINENFNDYGITNISWLKYYDMTTDLMISLIKEADILYYPGGAPDLMFERIKEKKIFDALKSFDKIIIGSSAGSMIQLDNYHISKDNEYFKYSMNEGMGYINNMFVEVHYRRRKKQKSSLRKVRRLYKKDTYIIPDDGAIIKINEKIITLGTARKFSNKKGIIK